MNDPKSKQGGQSKPQPSSSDYWYARLKAAASPDDEIDEVLLDAFATQIARHTDAKQRIESEGLIILNGRDQPEAHPALAIERAAGKQMTDLGGQLKQHQRTARRLKR